MYYLHVGYPILTNVTILAFGSVSSPEPKHCQHSPDQTLGSSSTVVVTHVTCNSRVIHCNDVGGTVICITHLSVVVLPAV
jgi:hypothetical protein